MDAGNTGKPRGKESPDDFGLSDKVRNYHRHGGPQGSDHAKTLEGEIGSTHAQHEHDLKKARPDSTPVRRK